jgi:beta-glucosidase
VQVIVDVQNVGTRAGDEVVQLYVHNNDATTTQPKEQLQGFERISLNAGETKTVSFSLSAEQLSFWDTNRHAFVVNSSAIDVMAGSASDDIRVKGSFQITTTGQWPGSELTTRAADGDYAAKR